MTFDHEGMAELVAAYALDAVEADEARLVEDHLRDCPRCRAELADHRDTASFLGHAGDDAPAGVWERIAGSIEAAPGSPPLRVVVGGAAVENEQHRLRRWSTRLVGVAAAAAIGLLAAGYLRTDHQVGQLRSALAANRGLERVTAAALDPRAQRVALTSWNGTVMAAAAVLPGGQAYLASEGLASLPGSRTYQLWAIVDGHPVSAGLMGADPGLLVFRVTPGAAVLAITDEPAGGSPRPTSAPVASATI
ncbi:MAG TPA: anti-sigma factor [Acidimicrobiales bacterium]|nr:anti-sigma factor [Acidimicrobiales bacterium]